jgi:hypothetical protein
MIDVYNKHKFVLPAHGEHFVIYEIDSKTYIQAERTALRAAACVIDLTEHTIKHGNPQRYSVVEKEHCNIIDGGKND